MQERQPPLPRRRRPLHTAVSIRVPMTTCPSSRPSRGQPELGAVRELACPGRGRERSPRTATGRSSGADGAGRARVRAWQPPPCARAGRRGRRGAPPASMAPAATRRASQNRRAARPTALDSAGRRPLLRGVPENPRARRGRDTRWAGTALGRPVRGAINPRMSTTSTHQLVSEPIDPSGDADQIAPLEPARQPIGIAECPRRDRARAVTQLERQVGEPVSRHQPILARAREDAPHLLAGAAAH